MISPEVIDNEPSLPDFEHEIKKNLHEPVVIEIDELHPD